MTLAIAHAEGTDEPRRIVLDVVREIRPPFSPDAVVGDFAALLKTYRVTTAHGDRYGGEWPAERFQAHGITYQPAEQTESDLYRDLLPLVNAARIELFDVPRLHAQLLGLERRTARRGRNSIDHAPGAHDDLANAAAGALVRTSCCQHWLPERATSRPPASASRKSARSWSTSPYRWFPTPAR
jgi:hypothetical protein